MKERTLQTIEAARVNRSNGIIYNTDAEIIELADEVDRLTLLLHGAPLESTTTGSRAVDLIGHHLTEAIRHLTAAAGLTRELTREDARDLALSLDRTLEAVREARGDVEGPAR